MLEGWLLRAYLDKKLMSQTKITSESLAANTIQSFNFADQAITDDKIASNAITYDKTAGGVIESTPIGSVIWHTASSAPVGYMVADGSLISRSIYSDLFSVIGTTYNISDDPVTHFRLPDLRGMYIRGWNNTKQNLINHSTYNVSTWSNFRPAQATLTTGIAAPDGTNTAIRFSALNNGNALLRVYFSPVEASGTEMFTYSFWCRYVSGTLNSCRSPYSDVQDQQGIKYMGQIFPTRPYINDYPQGWKRVVGNVVPAKGTINFLDLYSDQNTNFSLEFWGVQLERGSVATSYTPTNGTPIATGSGLDQNRLMGSIQDEDWKGMWWNNNRGNAGFDYITGYWHWDAYMGKNEVLFKDIPYIGQEFYPNTVNQLFWGHWNGTYANAHAVRWDNFSNILPANIALLPCIKYAQIQSISQTNLNISSLANTKLNLTGGNITGNLTVNKLINDANFAGHSNQYDIVQGKFRYNYSWDCGGNNLEIVSNYGVRIKKTGYYEVWCYLRGNGAAGYPYVLAGLDTPTYIDWGALQTRNDGIWTHSHAHGPNYGGANFAWSMYFGLLNEGEVIVAGSNTAGDTWHNFVNYSASTTKNGEGYAGGFFVKPL